MVRLSSMRDSNVSAGVRPQRSGVPHAQAMPEQTLRWLGEVVELIPEEAATAADRAELRNAAKLTAENPSSSRWFQCPELARVYVSGATPC